MNQTIENVLSGVLSMDEFLEKLQEDAYLQKYIRNLVPCDAINNPSHNFWKIVPYESLRHNNFDYYSFLFWALHSGDMFGNNFTIFSRLRKAYLFYHPDVSCTSKFEEEFNLYLDAIKECYDGPEVRELVEYIVADAVQFRSNAQKLKRAKMLVSEKFHVNNSKRPRWIQGPEWPMGSFSPMAFVGQKKGGDLVEFEFKDVDTGETKIVRQFY